MQTQLKSVLKLFMHLPFVVHVLWVDAQVLACRECSSGASRKCYRVLFLIVSVGIISY